MGVKNIYIRHCPFCGFVFMLLWKNDEIILCPQCQRKYLVVLE